MLHALFPLSSFSCSSPSSGGLPQLSSQRQGLKNLHFMYQACSVGWGGECMPRTPTWIIATPCIHQQSTLKVSGSGVCERHPLYHPHSFHLAFSWTFFPGVAAMPVSQFFQVSLKNASLLLHRAQKMRKPRAQTGKQEYRNFLPGSRYSATSASAFG